MITENLKNTLEPLGINFSQTPEGGSFKCFFHFMGNTGFYHILGKKCGFLILKGIFKDNIRLLKGKIPLDNKIISKIADTFSNIEKNIDFMPICSFSVADKIYLHDIEKDYTYDSSIQFDQRKVISCLSSVEFSLFQNSMASDKTLYSKGMLTEMLPETLYPLSISIINKIPDLINPLYLHAGFKTYSPSISIIAGKLFVNLSNMRFLYRTMGGGEDIINLNYAPSAFAKEYKKKLKPLDIKLLNMKADEVDEYLDELDKTQNKLNFNIIAGEEFQELLALFTMVGQMIALKINAAFINIHNIVKDFDFASSLIYKTRKTNIFESLNNKEIYSFFDIFAPKKIFTTDFKYQATDTSTLLKNAGFFTNIFKKDKLLQELKLIHRFLDRRDRLFEIAQHYMKSIDTIFSEIAENLVAKNYIKNKEDLRYLEIDEVKNIKNNSFYGNIPFTLYFKKSQHERYKAQFVPKLIFEKDIDKIPDIFYNLLKKYSDKMILKCVAVNPVKDLSFSYNNGDDSPATISSRIHMPELVHSKNIIICDYAPINSYIFEYAVISGKSLYVGTNGGDIFFRDKVVHLQGNTITVTKP